MTLNSLKMLKRYTVEDPDNPDVLIDIDIEEEENGPDLIGYRETSLPQWKEDWEKNQTKKPKTETDKGKEEMEEVKMTDKTAAQYAKRLLLTNRHVYKFTCIYASLLGIYNVQKLFKNPAKSWEEQQVVDTYDGDNYFIPENSAEILEQTLNGVYYGVIENAYSRIKIFKDRGIKLEYVIDSIKNEPKISSMFLQYAVIIFRSSNVAGFSAQPGRVYTKNGGVALNVHAGMQHRDDIQKQLNTFWVWFAKVRIVETENSVRLTLVDLRAPNNLLDFAIDQLAAGGAKNMQEYVIDDAVKKEKKPETKKEEPKYDESEYFDGSLI